ncbi:DUF2169 domain-containing protein [Serratia sp. UGAL515B_01]|uniref:DUF2169 family type VI secretion system accessory protein n=1 Tax=Serratia sp. UGAL515B_01 TaxID=2986763 RepID=UPI0029551BCA|nr:pentapeptide repeat-containing protein [Serratia sp. UGAL515B_01]WON77461.1 DUF2169 domain-containing protein [Serratia sp. UGAL515B_01]
MRIIRPQQLVVLKGSYQIGRESHMGISVIAGCYLSKPEHFVTESQIWQAWRSAPLSFHMLDSAEPKPFAEYLLAGHAVMGNESDSLDVQARVGSLVRRWRIERDGNQATTQGEPFTRIPMDHPQSWGGQGCKDNPLGQGYSNGNHPTLMSIGFDGAAISRSPLAAPTPIPHDFQVRKIHLDNVASAMTDKHYLENYYPGLPPQIDYRYFQMAPPSQWLKSAEWPETIAYELSGFRPHGEVITGSFLPVKARAFIHQRGGSEQQEITLQRKTVWLLPDHDLGLLVFTGSVPLTHLFDEPVETLMVALDDAYARREEAHYQQVYARRSQPSAPTFEFLNDPELMPKGISLNVIRDLADHPDSLRYRAAPLTEEESERFYQSVRIAIERQEQLKQPEPAPDVSMPLAESSAVALGWLQRNEESAENITFASIDFSVFGLQNKRFRYCTFNHCQFQNNALADCHFEFCQFIDCQFTQGCWNNVSLVSCMLKKSQLHKVTFTHCKYEKVTLESTRLNQCHFVDSLWDNCIVMQGDFSDSQFVQCTLNSSFFSNALLNQTRYEDSQLVSCVFDKCNGVNAVFTDCNLAKDSFIAGNWQGAHFNRCEINSVTTGLGIDLSESHFEQCTMNKVGFSKANLQASTFSYCSLLEGCCDKANLQQATITSCDMAALRFKDANLTHSYWQSTSLQQSMLYNADLRDTHFLRCNLAGANLAMVSQNLATRFENCLLEKTHWLPRRYIAPMPIHH